MGIMVYSLVWVMQDLYHQLLGGSWVVLSGLISRTAMKVCYNLS